MTVLPDPGRSRAVLIGASTYSHLEDLPAVRNNLSGFRDVLVAPELGGLPADNCTVIAEPASPVDVYRTLGQHARAAEDTLLVYFAGHGKLGSRNELFLCLPDTDPDELPYSAWPYDELRRVVADSPATKKVVILDCCFSGRAIPNQAGDEETILGQVGIEGSYLLTATAANALALAPPRERYTAFTGALLGLLIEGIPGGPELLTFGQIYPRLQYTLTSRQLPRPRQQGSDTIAHLALTRNLAYTRPDVELPTRSLAGAASASAPLPEPPRVSSDSPYPAVPAPRSLPDRLLLGAGQLALAAGLLLVGLVSVFSAPNKAFQTAYSVYVATLAVLALAAAFFLLRPATRRLVGPGLLLGTAAAAVWGLLFLLIDAHLHYLVPAGPGWWVQLAGLLVLVLAACLAAVALVRAGEVRLNLQRSPGWRAWLVILLGGAGALVLLVGTDKYFWSAVPYHTERWMEVPSVWATCMALAVPACAAVAVPRSFSVALLAGWLGGAAAFPWVSYVLDHSSTGNGPTGVFMTTLCALLVATVVLAWANRRTRPHRSVTF
jgi:hypothetical protein